MTLSASTKDSESWRTWIVGGYVAVAAIVALLWGWSLFSPIDEQEVQRAYDKLDSTAYAGKVALGESSKGAQELADELSGGGLRVSIIASSGQVLADSEADAAGMGNHAEREEVAAALAGQTGHARRSSTTDGTEYLYTAVPATWQGQSVVLRLAGSVAGVKAVTAEFRNTGLVLLAVAVIVGVVVAWLSLSRSRRPVTRLERMRTDFVANASHELKTPVAGIALLSESIASAAHDGDTQAISMFSKRLEKEASRLQHLVRDLLDLARLENRQAKERDTETSDFAGVVAMSFDAHLTRADAKGIEMELFDETTEGNPLRVRLSGSDATLLVDNLLENAINYTESGSVHVRVAAEDGHAVLSVEDTGIGIPYADQGRIFERFYRVDTAHSREMGGTGLGLSLVRHAVEDAGGAIQLESAPGAGSTFTVKLPSV